ncbi:SH3 domain-containing protein [Hymenobacter gummosus]|uniref:SH3 domain-containing protein n=1 Tax=Hymenobacter gummosus TaxID=1776032 RepID=A0A431TWU8_9BACT|nr:SH3 domain-containing protein [Hymenobacter gummosus]RTQ45868.1 SH3 domain-containing protein [Hymenobacter gummosus]
MLHLLLTTALLLGAAGFGPARGQIPPLAQPPVERTTGTTCGLYARPSSQAPMLTVVPPGTLVQVVDSSSKAHFVRAVFSKNGKTVSGYLFRACLATP